MQAQLPPTDKPDADVVVPNRRQLLRSASLGVAGVGMAALGTLVARRAVAQTAASNPAPVAPSLSDRLNEAGPEARLLASRVGLWDVTETFWPGPAAAAVTSTGLVAERVMMGTLLQEFIRPPDDIARTEVKRTDLLCYNRLDGRWDYVSFDMRVPVGLMPASSGGRGDPGRIEVTFLPFAVVGIGDGGTGQMIRMRQEIIGQAADHDRKDQYFTLADGTGTEWLAHRYDYVRRP